MNVFDYSADDFYRFAGNVCIRLAEAEDGDAAVRILSETLCRYTIFDLQAIGAVCRMEVEKLPEPYRSRYRPYSTDLMDNYHRFRAYPPVCPDIIDRTLWKSFWDSAMSTLFIDANSENDPLRSMGHPAGKLFYRLIYAYVMLIDNRPGHPVGMPFPGGWKVAERNGKILCPIRDKEKDLPQALCNFCPAEQDPDC